MNRWWRLLVLSCALGASACASLSPQERGRVTQLVQEARPQAVACERSDSCATPSALHQLGAEAIVESAPGAPRHRALLLDGGQDAMLARISLLRSATTSIDLQTYIFDEDDAGTLFIDELLAAARRGVRVRVLVDQLSALKRVETLAALSGAHANFAIRIYNPVLDRARLGYVQYLFAAACCWGKLNKRMHSKLLLVDGVAGITGGRNYQDDYYDWDAEYNFRDRDVLVAGPVAREMAANFEAFWRDPRSVPPYLLNDVGSAVLESGVPPAPEPEYDNPARVAALMQELAEPGRIEALAAGAFPVRDVAYVADMPGKHGRDDPVGATTHGLRELIESASDEVLLQTPYLVLSKPAQRMFRIMHRRDDPPRVIVSTNSLASTDSFITYALSYKYKRRYLRDFGFEIHEFKPFPANAPIDLAATGAALPPPPADAGNVFREPLSTEYSALRYYTRSANERVPLERAGVRIGLHAKSLVVDERVAVVGTHNFDPRGDHYNTENAVIIDDPAFARALANSIRRDIAPENSWTIGRRPEATPFTGLEYSLAKISEKMPIFDLWPMRYAVSFEFVQGPGCPGPLSPFDPRFNQCYRAVGDFPEVAVGFKSILTRIFTAFGSGLAPIL